MRPGIGDYLCKLHPTTCEKIDNAVISAFASTGKFLTGVAEAEKARKAPKVEKWAQINSFVLQYMVVYLVLYIIVRVYLTYWVKGQKSRTGGARGSACSVKACSKCESRRKTMERLQERIDEEDREELERIRESVVSEKEDGEERGWVEL